MNEITPKEAIANLNHIYGMVAPDIQRSLDVAIKALEKPQVKHDRQKGEWLEYNATGKKQYMCSECGMEEKNPKIARYCYWCGAKMKGEAEE